MSHYRLKTKYNTEGAYGSTEENEVFVHHNLSCDYVSFYDGNGKFIMTVSDTISNNLLDAINRLYTPFEKDGELAEGIEYMTKEERGKVFKLETPESFISIWKDFLREKV